MKKPPYLLVVFVHRTRYMGDWSLEGCSIDRLKRHKLVGRRKLTALT